MTRRQLLTSLAATSAMLGIGLKTTAGFAGRHSHGGHSHQHHHDDSPHEHHDGSDHRHDDEDHAFHYHHGHDDFDDHDHNCRGREENQLECADHEGKWE